jgi:DNA-binding YbaB/EbfC family protein
MYHCIVYALLITLVTSSAFVSQLPVTKSCSISTAFTPRPLHLFWFGKDGDKVGTSDKKKVGATDRKGEVLGGVSQVMDSMEAFKKGQQVGTLTSNLLQELGGTNVEGNAADGKVRVFFDGQQRPKRVQIDETYVRDVDIDDLNSALAVAMQDAYKKSREKMEEKMKELYGELGLPPSTSRD